MARIGARWRLWILLTLLLISHPPVMTAQIQSYGIEHEHFEANQSTSPPALNSNTLPNLGNPERVSFSRRDEKIAGFTFLRQIFSVLHILDDPIINQYISDLGSQITNVSQHNERQFRFFLIYNNAINAFAGPDGHIGIHTGLILKTKSEEELISVIAHEVAHVTQNHLARTIKNANESQTSSMLAGLAIVLAGIYSDNTQVAGAGLYTSIARQHQSFLANSRTFENEADAVGQKYLQRAQYSTLAMPIFFSRLSELEGQSGIPEYLKTHPLSLTRLSNALSRANLVEQPEPKESLTFQLVQARVAYLTGIPLDQSHRKIAHEYYQALQWQSKNNPKLDKWLERNKDKHLYFKLLYINRNLSANRELARQAFNEVKVDNPRHLAVQKLMLEFENDDTEKLVIELKQLATVSAQPHLTYEWIAKLYAQKDNRTANLLYKALSIENKGLIRNALTLLELAKKSTEKQSEQDNIQHEIDRLTQIAVDL